MTITIEEISSLISERFKERGVVEKTKEYIKSAQRNATVYKDITMALLNKHPADIVITKGKIQMSPQLHIFITTNLFGLFICDFQMGFNSYRSGGAKTLFDYAAKCIKEMEETGDPAPNPVSFLMFPISFNILNSLLMRYGLYKGSSFSAGELYFLYGKRGSGKTSLSYWSIAVPLLILGFDPKEIKEIYQSIHKNSIEEYFEILKEGNKLAKKQKGIPFVVFDDAGEYLNRNLLFLGFGKKYMKELMFGMNLGRIEQISREGIDNSIYIGSPDSLIKPLRMLSSTSDYNFYGEFKDMFRRYTLWFSGLKGTSSKLRLSFSVFPTIHPVLRVPDDLFVKLNEEKTQRREKLLKEMGEDIKKSEKRRKNEEDELEDFSEFEGEEEPESDLFNSEEWE